MNWTELLKSEIESSYGATFKLLDMVTDEMLEWKPDQGDNWMAMGQLLFHLSMACGSGFKGFLTDDWGLPDGVSFEDLAPEEMLPQAEKMPAVESIDRARELVGADKLLALEMLARCSEEELNTQEAPAPWDPTPMILGQRLLQNVVHLSSHKSQLFYYLKLLGLPVNTTHLWNM